MVTIVGYGYGDRSSNPGQAVYWVLNIGIATSLRGGKLRLKFTSCHILLSQRYIHIYIYIYMCVCVCVCVCVAFNRFRDFFCTGI